MTAAPAPLDDARARIARRVEAAAERIALVGRATPVGYAAEVARLTAAARGRARGSPRFRYRAADGLDEIARALDLALGDPAGRDDPELAARIAEAQLELEIARAIDTPRLPALAARRFGSTPEDDARATRWSRLSASDDGERRVVSDDRDDAHSLLSVLRRAIGSLRLPVRVVVREDLAALAATGDGVVQIAGRRLHTERQALRVAVHEIEGHVLPSLRRRAAGAPMRPAGDADLEEGRALVAELRAGLLDRERRAELGRRHVAARMAHDGADLWQIVEALEGLGERVDGAVRVASRALRGGGLGRERVYVGAYARARALDAAEASRARQDSNLRPGD
ncbi:MAG: DUF1704 domain-containing protein [Polyangiaceae bacterium]|nr:DUF1704 domain-containing protein [Polyangiaceae bacterium]